MIALGVVMLGLSVGQDLLARHRRRAPRRALERAKTAAIASLQQGELTKITGVVAPREAMLASAVGKESCIGYSTAVESATGGGAWRPVLNPAACASFLVTDESGTAVVEGTIVILHPDGGWETAPASLLPRKDDGRSLASQAPTLETRSRYREILLKPGDRVSVFGRAKMEIDPAGRSSFRDPPMLNHITGSDDAPVIVAHDIITLG